MAKKKKAPEAKAPLRGLQDTPTNTNSYIVHDPDHELAMKVTDGSVDGVWLDGNDISGGGGGGLTDSTVTMHFSVISPEVATISWFCIGTAGQSTGRVFAMEKRNIMGEDLYYCVNGNTSIAEDNVIPFTFAILESGSFRIDCGGGYITNVTGSATWNEGDLSVYPNGDCDIYITAD